MGRGIIAERERGELLMAISDLTGTSWLFPATGVGLSGGDILASISFESNGNEFIRLDCSEGLSGPVLVYRDVAATTVYDAATGWIADGYRIIDITGGSDATSAAMIAWLEAEAQQTDPPALRKTYLTTGAELASVADAIRARGSTRGQPWESPIEYPDGYVDAIAAIPHDRPEIAGCILGSGSGTTMVTLGADPAKAFVYSYDPNWFDYNAGVFTAKQAGTYWLDIYARGSYNSSGTQLSCFWQVLQNDTAVISATSGTTYRNAGATTGGSVTLAVGDELCIQQRVQTGTTSTTVGMVIRTPSS